jgi:hypothetical protein
MAREILLRIGQNLRVPRRGKRLVHIQMAIGRNQHRAHFRRKAQQQALYKSFAIYSEQE